MISKKGHFYLAMFPECWGEEKLLLRAERSGAKMESNNTLEFTVMRNCRALDGELWAAGKRATLQLDAFTFKRIRVYMENK